MNFKSNMLKILVVFALIFMLIPVIAAEDVSQDEGEDAVSESESVDEVADEEIVSESDNGSDNEVAAAEEEPIVAAAGEEPALVGYPVPVASGFLMDLPAADLEVNVYPQVQYANVGDLIVWLVTVSNYGPDTAVNTFANVTLLQGDIMLLYYLAEDGIYDPVSGIWLIGDIPAGMQTSLLLLGQALSDTEAVLSAYALSDTYDPDYTNNYDLGFAEFGAPTVAAEVTEETLPATGNPIFMVLLALISIAGATVGRKL